MMDNFLLVFLLLAVAKAEGSAEDRCKDFPPLSHKCSNQNPHIVEPGQNMTDFVRTKSDNATTAVYEIILSPPSDFSGYLRIDLFFDKPITALLKVSEEAVTFVRFTDRHWALFKSTTGSLCEATLTLSFAAFFDKPSRIEALLVNGKALFGADVAMSAFSDVFSSENGKLVECAALTSLINGTRVAFRYAVSQVFAYVIGFKFSAAPNTFSICGEEVRKTKVNNSSWFITRIEDFKLHEIDFQFYATFSDPSGSDGNFPHLGIEEISFNGKKICQREIDEFDEDFPELLDLNREQYEFDSLFLLVVFSVSVCSFAVTAVFGFCYLKRIISEYWSEVHMLVLSSKRLVTGTNPNVRGVPLPKVPGEDSSQVQLRRSYKLLKELEGYRCSNRRCSKVKSVVTDILGQLPEITLSEIMKDNRTLLSNPSFTMEEEDMTQNEDDRLSAGKPSPS